jgi:AcrR family transcriptional regulator
MGRRSSHTPEELRELILTAAEDIIEAGGLAELSAREVARRIDYSPGTLYNMFENLADLVLHVEARVLTRLDEHLQNAVDASTGEEAIRRLSVAYLKFSHESPRLWNLLFEHHMPPGTEVPDWYQAKLMQPLRRLEREFCDLAGGDTTRGARAAWVLWAGLHGIASLSTAHKAGNSTVDHAHDMLEELLDCFLAGLRERWPS